MFKAWYINDKLDDPSPEHHRSPPEFVSQKELYQKTGVEYFKLNIDTLQTDGVLDKLKKERNFKSEDDLVMKYQIPDYEKDLNASLTEHLHANEEIRLVLEGSGFFDVRDENDQWIRIDARRGDLIIIPGGSYHRFILKFDIKMKRLYSNEKKWESFSRPADDMTCRKNYVGKLTKGFIATASVSG